MGKNTPANAGNTGLALEKGMATQSSILAWEIHGQWILVGYIQSMGSQRIRHDSVTEQAHACMYSEFLVVHINFFFFQVTGCLVDDKHRNSHLRKHLQIGNRFLSV